MMSEKFTIDDIHRIRYENFENTKNLTPQELIEKTKYDALESKTRIAELRKKAVRVQNLI